MTLNEPGGPWLLAMECKGPKTPVRDSQVAWAAKWEAAGLPYFVVRHPQDLLECFEAVEFPASFDVRGEYPTENDVQKGVKGLLERYGWDVTDTSQGFRRGGKRHGTTRITLGTPDLFATHPARS